MAINFTQAYAFKSGTITNSAVPLTDIAIGFTQAEVDKASQMVVSSTANGLSYRYDGGAPTASAGHPIAAGGTAIIQGVNNIRNFQVIRSGGSDATIAITLEQ